MSNMIRFMKTGRERLVFGIAFLAAAVLFIALSVGAATTLSTNISTAGTLAVTGASTLTGNVAAGGAISVTGASTLVGNVTAVGNVHVGTDLNISGGDIGLGSGSATTTISSSGGLLGIASTTPWGLLSVEQISGTLQQPVFVVGDQGTSTAHFKIDQKGKSSFGGGTGITDLAFGSCTLGAVTLEVAGDTGAQDIGHTSCTDATGVDANMYTVVQVLGGDWFNDVVIVSASSTDADTINFVLKNTSTTTARTLAGTETVSFIGIR